MVLPIKFKAWDTISKRMVVPEKIAFHHLEGTPTTITVQGVEWAAQRFVLRQWTGLKDNNGTEIYEGDICELKTPGKKGGKAKNHQVIWDDGFRFDGDVFGVYHPDDHLVAAHCHQSTDTVVTNIGNVYQNPELLKNK